MSVANPISPATRVAGRVCCVGTPRLGVLVAEKGPQIWPCKHGATYNPYPYILPRRYLHQNRVWNTLPNLPNVWVEYQIGYQPLCTLLRNYPYSGSVWNALLGGLYIYSGSRGLYLKCLSS